MEINSGWISVIGASKRYLSWGMVSVMLSEIISLSFTISENIYVLMVELDLMSVPIPSISSLF